MRKLAMCLAMLMMFMMIEGCAPTPFSKEAAVPITTTAMTTTIKKDVTTSSDNSNSGFTVTTTKLKVTTKATTVKPTSPTTRVPTKKVTANATTATIVRITASAKRTPIVTTTKKPTTVTIKAPTMVKATVTTTQATTTTKKTTTTTTAAPRTMTISEAESYGMEIDYSATPGNAAYLPPMTWGEGDTHEAMQALIRSHIDNTIAWRGLQTGDPMRAVAEYRPNEYDSTYGWLYILH